VYFHGFMLSYVVIVGLLVSVFDVFTIFNVIFILSVLVRAAVNARLCFAVLFTVVFSLSYYLHVSLNEINGDYAFT